MERLLKIISNHTYPFAFEDEYVPVYFREILRDLRTLAIAKSLLTKKAIQKQQELRQLFSSLLFVVEHRILELGFTSSSRSTLGNARTFSAVKAAAFVFTIHGLRDMAITAAFYDSLIWRIRDGLGGSINDVHHDQIAANTIDTTASATFLLWLCLNGWQASRTKWRQIERQLFIEKANMLCEGLQIDSLADLYAHISKIMPMTEYHQSACSGLWTDMKAGTNFSDKNWLQS